MTGDISNVASAAPAVMIDRHSADARGIGIGTRVEVGVLDVGLSMRGRMVGLIVGLIVGMLVSMRVLLVAVGMSVSGRPWISDGRRGAAAACGQPQSDAHNDRRASEGAPGSPMWSLSSLLHAEPSAAMTPFRRFAHVNPSSATHLLMLRGT